MINVRGLVVRYQGLSTRERALVLVTVMAATWGIWISTFGGALIDQVASSEQNLKNIQLKLAGVSAKFSTLQQEGADSELAALKQQRQQLRDEVELAQDELDQLLERFIPPSEVPLLLEDMLVRYEGLKLKSLHSQTSEKITVQLPTDVQQYQNQVRGQTEASMDVYRHPFQLELRGSFRDVVGYLDQLERSEWQLQWRSLDYVVADFPEATVVLRIETLSRSAEWIGV